MNLLYVKIAGGIVCILSIFFAGWHIRDVDFMAYKKEVQATAEKQEAKVKSIRAQQELVTKGIQDEHNAKLVAVRNYYRSTSLWNNTSGSTVPGISNAPSATDVITAYNGLAGRCAETTLTLIDLQKWLNEQIGIK